MDIKDGEGISNCYIMKIYTSIYFKKKLGRSLIEDSQPAGCMWPADVFYVAHVHFYNTLSLCTMNKLLTE